MNLRTLCGRATAVHLEVEDVVQREVNCRRRDSVTARRPRLEAPCVLEVIAGDDQRADTRTTDRTPSNNKRDGEMLVGVAGLTACPEVVIQLCAIGVSPVPPEKGGEDVAGRRAGSKGAEDR